MVERPIQRLPLHEIHSERHKAREDGTHHPSGFAGALSGMGSIAVMRRQWYRHKTGRCTTSCHFFDTVSTPSSSFTVRNLKTFNARSGARFPTISNVDLAYFSSKSIWRRISPGMQESRMIAILQRGVTLALLPEMNVRGTHSRIRSSLLSPLTTLRTSSSLNPPPPSPLSTVARSTSPPIPSSSLPRYPLQYPFGFFLPHVQ